MDISNQINNQIMINFSTRLIDLLRKKGYSSNRSSAGVKFHPVAEAIGCSKQMVRKYILGEAMPDPETIVKLANFLEVQPGWLLFGDNPMVIKNDQDTEIAGIDYELLKYILIKIIPLTNTINNHEEVARFALDIIHDTSHINADRKLLFKIVDLSISSASRFHKTETNGNEDESHIYRWDQPTRIA